MSIRNWEAHLEIKGCLITSFKVSNPDELADKLTLDDLQICDKITLVPVRLDRDANVYAWRDHFAASK
jgi:hypothetical protein